MLSVCLAVMLSMIVAVSVAYGETIQKTVEGGMNIAITYPESAIAGKTFPISILVENKGWENKQDVRFSFESEQFVLSQDGFVIDVLSDSGTHGETITATSSAPAGTYFLNVDYSHVLIQNNETPLKPFRTDIAVPVTVKDAPTVLITAKTPESVFPGAEFLLEIDVVSKDMDLRDLRVVITPPHEVDFSGQSAHSYSYSNVQRGTPIEIKSHLRVLDMDLAGQREIPIILSVAYEETVEERTVHILLRPRTLMEITSDGGIWIGTLFIAPYVSIGTLVGIPAGALLSLFLRSRRK